MAKTIIANLCGGLGNQMFQYAFARRMSLQTQAPLLLDVSAIATDPLRSYALAGFAVAAVVATEAECAAIRPWQLRLPHRLRGMPSRPGGVRYVRERSFTFDQRLAERPISGSAYVEGYWQSEKYFADIVDTIRRDFQLVAPMSDRRCEIARKIASTSAISVHVRRGDYISNTVANAYHGTCAPEWYEGAMNVMADGVEDPTFFVFSDDPAWARTNLPSRWAIQFVEPQTDSRDFEDMHLMAACRHHITANSSFSWWGTWLDPRPDKRVIVPKRWFNGAGHDTRDLIPTNWQQM